MILRPALSSDAVAAAGFSGLGGPNTNGLGAPYEYLALDDNSYINLSGTSWTIALWAQLVDGNALSGILGKCNGIGVEHNNDFALYANVTAGEFNLFVSSDGTAYVEADSSLGGIDDDTWYFIVCQYDGSMEKAGISVNNSAFDSESIDATHHGDMPFLVGIDYVNIPGNTPNPTTGSVANLGIWKRLLTGAEITALYNAGVGLAYPFTGESSLLTNLQAYWGFGTSSNLGLDSTANGNNMTNDGCTQGAGPVSDAVVFNNDSGGDDDAVRSRMRA